MEEGWSKGGRGGFVEGGGSGDDGGGGAVLPRLSPPRGGDNAWLFRPGRVSGAPAARKEGGREPERERRRREQARPASSTAHVRGGEGTGGWTPSWGS